jgi:hypothetical protein
MNRLSPKKIRVSIDLSESYYDRLGALEKLTEAETKAGVIRQALQVYEYIAKRAADGYSFRSVAPDGTEENLVFFVAHAPALETVHNR